MEGRRASVCPARALTRLIRRLTVSGLARRPPYRILTPTGGSSLAKIWAGLNNPKGLKKMLEQCDVVFATEYVYDRVREIVGQKKQVIRVSIHVDADNVELIREHFAWRDGRLSKGANRGAGEK